MHTKVRNAKKNGGNDATERKHRKHFLIIHKTKQKCLLLNVNPQIITAYACYVCENV